jgi:Do/DeqQ family serine protease
MSVAAAAIKVCLGIPLQNARILATFLVRAVIVGLAAAFLVVWFKPKLLDVTQVTPPPPPEKKLVVADVRTPAPIVVASFADAVARAAPAVVNIYTARVVTEKTQVAPLDQLFGDYLPSYRQHVERSLGSGVIVSDSGTIVTNQHVIADADSIKVQIADGRIADARIVGQDPETDLAVLHLSIGKLPTMPMGRSDNLRVGDIVLAIGNPYGLSQTVTQGIVSATGRGQLGLATFENFIQTDAAINLGNSGGALIDARGTLVGINTAVLNRGGGGGAPEGIGFAIPVNLVRGVMEQIIAHGHVIRGWLGLISQDLTDEQAAQLGIVTGGGVTVTYILGKSPAFDAGIRPGDVITSLGGEQVKSAQDLVVRVAALRPGSDVEVEGRHGPKPFKFNVKVIERPTRDSQRPG